MGNKQAGGRAGRGGTGGSSSSAGLTPFPPSYSANSSNSSIPSSTSTSAQQPQQQQKQDAVEIPTIPIRELQEATNNFNDKAKVGEGGVGEIYRCSLRISQGGEMVDAAVKRINFSADQGYEQWEAELALGSSGNPCLVNLLAQGSGGQFGFLVYKFYENGSVHDYLRSCNALGRTVRPLTWKERVRIARDAAEGLVFLHDQGLVHRDVKAHNVLLAEDMHACVSDFGFVTEGPGMFETHKSVQELAGTVDYVDPQYYYDGQLSFKSDVYSFGVLLLVLLSGRSREDSNTPSAMDYFRSLSPKEFLDKQLDTRPASDVNVMLKLARQCLEEERTARPTMKEVVKTLKSIPQ